jgi:hypothetical protein
MERRQFVTGLSSLIVSAAASAACAGVGAPVPTTRPPRVPGQSTWRESVDGHEREAIALTPPGSGPTPLVIVMHGSKGSPEQMIGDHGWAETLRARGWAGLFPRDAFGAFRAPLPPLPPPPPPPCGRPAPRPCRPRPECGCSRRAGSSPGSGSLLSTCRSWGTAATGTGLPTSFSMSFSAPRSAGSQNVIA